MAGLNQGESSCACVRVCVYLGFWSVCMTLSGELLFFCPCASEMPVRLVFAAFFVCVCLRERTLEERLEQSWQ